MSDAIDIETFATEDAERAFPASGSSTDKLRYLLRWAVLAPSNHNTQPWLFDIVGDTVLLYADRTRSLPVVDPYDRELVISCGACLFYLRLAMRHFGYEAHVEPLPDGSVPDLLARVRLGERAEASDEVHMLFRAIPQRRTNRKAFEDRTVPEPLLMALRELAGREGAWLRVLETEGERRATATLTAEADRVQWADKRFRRELATWLQPERGVSRDGLSGSTLGFEGLLAYTAPKLVRTFDLGSGRAAKNLELAEGSPALLVLGTDKDTRAAWLATGQALACVLLRAAADGVSASFLNQAIEVAQLRSQLPSILGRSGFPQIVLRVGYGPQVPATPRRAMADVLL